MDTYDLLREEIAELRKDLRPIADKVHAHDAKLNNGLSELPGEIRWVRNLLVLMLISLVLGGGAGLWAAPDRFSRLETKVEIHQGDGHRREGTP